jgi:hypothetical protein
MNPRGDSTRESAKIKAANLALQEPEIWREEAMVIGMAARLVAHANRRSGGWSFIARRVALRRAVVGEEMADTGISSDPR